MTRRLILLTATAAIVVISAGLAAADTAGSLPAPSDQHEVCLVMSHDPQHKVTDDFCVNF